MNSTLYRYECRVLQYLQAKFAGLWRLWPMLLHVQLLKELR